MIDFLEFKKLDGSFVSIAPKYIESIENDSHDNFETWFCRITLASGRTFEVKGDADEIYSKIMEEPWKADERLSEIKVSLDGIKAALNDTANTLDAMYLNGIG